jgi:hypothetical protein
VKPGTAIDQLRTWDHALHASATYLYFDRSFYDGSEPQCAGDRWSDARGRLEAAVQALRESVSFEGFDTRGRRTRPASQVIASGKADALEEARLLWSFLKRRGVEAELAYTVRPLIDHFDKDAPYPRATARDRVGSCTTRNRAAALDRSYLRILQARRRARMGSRR